MEYNFRKIEKDWQQQWQKSGIYKVSNDSAKPKCYVLDMFPYPSGVGLHVGHPLGYIASDIFSRYKRLKGFNVLHPMGYDAFGLPAEQYAIEHGIHPAVSTDENIRNFRGQMENMGFSFDWSREIRTSDPHYYKWTQWIFLQLFNSYFNRKTNKAEPIAGLIAIFEKEGNATVREQAAAVAPFTAAEWEEFDEKRKQDILMEYRLAYCGHGEVNWCEALGTVLANDEVINGLSERGGHPVVKKKLRQWYLRITAYAERLLEGLDRVEFSEAMKEMQTNWIGKSYGAEIDFDLSPNGSNKRAENSAFGLAPNPSPGGEGSETLKGSHSFKTATSSAWKVLKEFGRENRKNPTEAEDIFWHEVRDKKLGVRARRQHTIGEYIVDFAFIEVGLVVEIDGEYHKDEDQARYDEARTAYLKEFNFDVIRFTNQAVLTRIVDVLNSLRNEIEKRKTEKLSAGVTGAPLLHTEKGTVDEAVLRVYTTRPDTIFGVDFMVLAPEHELVEKITTPEQAEAVKEYIAYVKSRSERERMAEKKITGVFTGAYALNPFDGRGIPVWISEYVLAGYGTGAIMAVPCGDERDFKFAKHFAIPITNIIGSHFNGEEANPTKDAILENSGFLKGVLMRDAIELVIGKIESMGIGHRKVNYKMRDAAFSRQRYWGEPFPIIWKEGIAIPLPESELPLELPHVESYRPGPEGEGPLANIPEWVEKQLETNTMPGYAGSSWYFLRYMDSHNEKEFCSRKASDYWGQVDLYIGGTEHAVGHLLYSRMWTKALFDLGLIGHDEPYRKLVNQGMIQGSSRFVYRVRGKEEFVSLGQKDNYETDALHVDVNFVDGTKLDIEAFRNWKPEFKDASFIFEDGSSSDHTSTGTYICGSEVEKMSKSKFNTVNPDNLVDKYGADTFRMYEMFLGPVEMSKPWDTKGIEGVHRFLKKLWRLFFDELKGKVWTDEEAKDAEWKILYRSIRKIEEDTERFSFNTAVSAFMVCVNELTDLGCRKKEVLEKLLAALAPYAPHVCEELWHQLGNRGSILDAAYPAVEEKFLVETSKDYPISVNGKVRTNIGISLNAGQAEVEQIILKNEVIQKWLDGKPPKKVIYVKNKMINVVV